jgi:hypothetical protein
MVSELPMAEEHCLALWRSEQGVMVRAVEPRVASILEQLLAGKSFDAASGGVEPTGLAEALQRDLLKAGYTNIRPLDTR